MPERKASPWVLWVLMSTGVVALDQLVKHVVERAISPSQPLRVTPFFDLVLVYNPGAAFSFLSTASGWQRELFIGVALLASVLMLHLLRKHAAERLFCLALSLVLGGAVGNVIDRFRVGAVVDFLHFHAGQYYWPAFNLADSAITCGAGLLIWDSLRRSRVRAADRG